MFESKPIKRGGKIPFQHFHHSTHIPKPICIQEVEQHESSSSYEEREGRLGEDISQDAEGVGGNCYDSRLKMLSQETTLVLE